MIEIITNTKITLHKVDIESAVIKYLQSLGWQPTMGTLSFTYLNGNLICNCEATQREDLKNANIYNINL